MNYIAACILYLLWKRRRNGDGALATAKKLREELIAGIAGTNFRQDLNIATVKKALVELQRAGMLTMGVTAKEDSEPGPPPNGYRFSADPPIITLRATAAIVMHLHNHRDQRVKREILIQEILALKISHHSANEPLSQQDVDDQIDYCLRKEYLQEVDPPIHGKLAESTEKLLATTAKVDQYSMFLKKLADEVKRPVAAEQGPGDSIENRGLRGG